MSGRLLARPDKNEFLLYSMLNALGLARGHPDSHLLRRKTIDHFKGYRGIGLKEEDYIHHSKPVSYVLTLNEAPDFSERKGIMLDEKIKRDVEAGRAILPSLIHFYQNTDFEDFYRGILPDYTKECEFMQGILERANINDLLDNLWEVSRPFDMELIPMPLEAIHSGIGPSIGDTTYPVVGPPFNYWTLHIAAHEGSHPRAKRMLESITGKISAKSNLLKKALAHPNYPIDYKDWGTCFEEHFIRAMQAGYIDPSLGKNDSCNIEHSLRQEEWGAGMVYIKDFYEEIKKHKENPSGNMTDVALKILDRLDKKYNGLERKKFGSVLSGYFKKEK